MTTLFDPQIAQWIPGNFPKTYQEDGPMFVAFVKAYYEWLQQSNNVVNYARSLPSLLDIDETLDQFVIHFKNEYMDSLPGNVVVDQRLLIKNITDLYRAKGSKKSYELLFRILFNEDIKIYLPGQDILKFSDNEWIEESYLEVTDSIYLPQLVGNPINTSSGVAIVEDYHIITIQNKVINVLTLSNISGTFSYGDHILSVAVPDMNELIAPRIVGSLSKISIEDGGAFYNVGDILNISGSGSGAQARVVSTINQNGEVIFKLINGGYGFTINPNITVTGGYGSGATFKVGSLSNISVYVVNIDQINAYYNTQLDISSEGFILNISGETGAFTVGETVTSSANSLALDYSYLTGNSISNGEYLTNTSLGINLQIVHVDSPNYVRLIGPDTGLMNANIVGGITLLSNTTGNLLHVNSVLSKENNSGSGTVLSSNTSTIYVDIVTGNYLPTATVRGVTSGHTATINSVIRQTQWEFASGFVPANLDARLEDVLIYENLQVGTISSLIGEFPGVGYSLNPVVNINEPLISQLTINDGQGGIWGADANVSANAINASGIVTAVEVIASGYGYVPDENLILSAANVALNQTSLSGVAVVDSQGVAPGYWTGNQSILSDTNYIQDSYYYQDFSYEILAPRMLSTYQNFVNDLLHPVGFQLFGRYWINDYQQSNTSIAYSNYALTTGNGIVSYYYLGF